MKDIISGKIDFEEFDRTELDREKLDKSREIIKQQEARHKIIQGRTGKGHQGGYKLFCERCHIEYLIDDIDKCTHCSKDLMTQEVSNICRNIWNILETSQQFNLT